ncbi:FkbM family methyltransferase [uncultured Sphingomonas sp.]|uniref:FkbM family methyltransferase n=1 Tax=uncultured Sphingomonas sp. TaxID=158754 RepID=UPI0035CB2F42
MGVISAIRRQVSSPLAGIVSRSDYRAVRRSPPHTPGSTHLLGRPVAYADGGAILYSAQEIFKEEVYRFTAKTDRPHIIDAGANIGLSVIYFKQLYPDATIVAYEPDTAVFRILEQNTANLPGVTLHQAAAWTEETELSFYSDPTLAGSLGVDFYDRGNVIKVKAERLRDEIAKRPVDFLKIDIEGAENDVLFDIEDQLDNVDHLFFEYHSDAEKPQRLGDMLNLVTRNGFRYTINGPHGSPLPFVQPIRKGYDLQLNIACVRPG